MINWQLSKQGIRWPVSSDRTTGSSVHPSKSSIFWSYLLTNYQFQMIVGSSSFFSNDSYEICCVCHYDPELLRFWFQTDLGRENSAMFFKYMRGRPFLTMVTRWSRSTSNSYTLIGQKIDRWVHAENLCSIMKVVYFESRSWQNFVSTCNVFNCLFHWMYKMKYSCYQESSVIHGWFVYWVFGWEMRCLSKFGNPISDCIVFVFDLA